MEALLLAFTLRVTAGCVGRTGMEEAAGALVGTVMVVIDPLRCWLEFLTARGR